MRIRGWSIEGFGHFRDYVVENLPEGLIVFRGPNEAGKTTLLAFLRGVLFGFPEAGPEHYPALRGGRHGGRLTVVGKNGSEGSDGEYAIERGGPGVGSLRVTRPDGSEGSRADLHALLAGVDDALFRAVFAFGLPELQAFETLDGEALRDRIFSASLAGAGRSATAVVEHLTRGASRLLGDDGRIDTLVDALNQLAGPRDAARRAALAYADTGAEARRIAGEIADLRRRAGDLQAAHRRAELLADLWPQWTSLREAKSSLAALEVAPSLPDQLPERLREANGRLGAARAVSSALEEEQEEAARQRDRGVDAAALERMPRVEDLHQDLALQRARLERLVPARARRGEADRRLRQRLEPLGAGWTVEAAVRCDVSAVARAGLRALEKRAAELAADESERSAAVARACEPRDVFLGERARVAAEIAAAEEELRKAEEERESLARLRSDVDELAKEHARGEHMDRKLQDREVAMRSSEAEVIPEPPAWLPPVLWAVVPIAVLAMPWRALHADLAGVAAFALTAFVSALGAWTATQLRRWRAANDRRRESESRVLRTELYEARRMRDTHWRRAAELLETVAREAIALGLPRLPTATQIEKRERELARRGEQSDELDLFGERLREIDAELERSRQEIAVLEQHVDEVRKAKRGWEREWAAWKAERAVPENVAVESAREILDLAQHAQVADRELAAADAEIADLERDVAGWDSVARELLELDGSPVAPADSGEPLIERFVALHTEHVENQARHLAALRLDRELEERGRRIVEARAEADRHAAVRAALLAEAGVSDEAEVERRRALSARRQALEQAVGERERTLSASIAREPDADAIRASLAAADPEVWKRRAADSERELRAIEQRLLEAAARHRDVERRCQELEETPEVARLELEWNGLRDELAAAVRRWRVLRAARSLTEETLEEFRARRQPPVLAEASHSFQLVTDGRYRRIEQDESGQGLVALEVDGSRKRVPEGLSRGTAEQLYLCMRLGLVADFARRGTSLPVVMDDVLVNFDPGRAGAMAVALGDFARSRQLLFFTCHPHVCAMLEQLGGASAVIQL